MNGKPDMNAPVTFDKLEVGFDVGTELVKRGLVLADALFDELGRLAEQARQDLFDELLLTGEMVRDDALADPRFAGDLRERGLRKPLGRNGLNCGLDDLPTPRLFDEARLFLADRLKI